MQLPLFKALKTINIEDEQATEIVDSMEDYIAMKMQEATAPLAARIEGLDGRMGALDAKLGALDTKIGALQWTIGIIGAVIAIATAFSGVARFITH
ncbi:MULTISPECIES: hypothetical protein [Asaia]|uniref:Uncharacterized protein n=1 Tax=Asaia bogorensis TaxID=91915 RepID=A0A060QE27_9PROT|nr:MULTISPECIES: hypothetical protein [Asaia]ETC99482.1 hypothetical protein P792_03335 [Asaia sp. SF2.1]CDG38953.1 hypothetical protein ASAP_0908 [Asaia bogorensis]